MEYRGEIEHFSYRQSNIQNLRTRGVCKIALDIPKTGNYHFKCMKNAPESDLDSTN